MCHPGFPDAIWDGLITVTPSAIAFSQPPGRMGIAPRRVALFAAAVAVILGRSPARREKALTAADGLVISTLGKATHPKVDPSACVRAHSPQRILITSQHAHFTADPCSLSSTPGTSSARSTM